MNPGDDQNNEQHLRDKRKRGPYKGYLLPGSTLSVPKSTLHDRRKKSGREVDVDVCVPPVAINPAEDNVVTGEDAASRSIDSLFPADNSPQCSIPEDQGGDWGGNSTENTSDENSAAESADEGNADEDEASGDEDEASGDEDEASEDEARGDDDGDSGGVNSDEEHHFEDNVAFEENADEVKINYAEKNKLNDRLHPNCPVSRLEVLMMILHLSFRHCNTENFVKDQIKFVNALFGEAVLDVSYSIFKQVFHPSATITRHFFCADCELYIGSQHDFPKTLKVTKCPKCKIDLNISSVYSANYFVTVSLRNQFEMILEKPDVKLVDHTSRNDNDNVITDIFSGEFYKQCRKEGLPFENPNALSVTFNTDGVAVYQNSAKNSLWPILLHINEIIPEQRFRNEIVILGGLWFGRSAPNMALFLTPFLKELFELSENGVRYMKPDGSVVVCPVYRIACSLDSVAKAKVMCQKQFNGRKGCLYCLHPNDSYVGNNLKQKFYNTSSSYPLRSEFSR